MSFQKTYDIKSKTDITNTKVYSNPKNNTAHLKQNFLHCIKVIQLIQHVPIYFNYYITK